MYVNQWLKDILGSAFAPALRGAERLLPLPVLHALLTPYAMLRARQDPRPYAPSLPICPNPALPPVTAWDSTTFEQTRILEFLPDRLHSARWQKRCHIAGLDRLLDAHRRGPVVLAFSHIGPIVMTGFWLRTHGIPTAGLRMGSIRDRTRTQKSQDRYLPFPEVPVFLYLDQIRELARLLSAGGVVLVAIDNPTGRLLDVPIGERGTFRMATGAMRLAARHGAALIPCNIGYEGPWRFRVEIGQPVPKEHLLGKEPNLVAAGQHLVAEMMPHWRRYANQSFTHLLEAFRPAEASHTTPDSTGCPL